MKKFVLGLIAVVASLTASAQTFVGGALGFNRDFDENVTEFSLLPEVGYCFNSHWAAGMEFGYTHRYDDGICANLGVISPYARWTYYASSNKLVSLFIDGGVGFIFGTSKIAGLDNSTSDTSLIWTIGLKPGIALRPSEHFAILAHIGSLGYQGVNDQAKACGFTSNFGLNFNTTSLNLGFHYIF